LRVDDATIPNKLIVWRELDPLEAPFDPQTGQRKIMSSLFRTEELSVRMSDHLSKAQVLETRPVAIWRNLRLAMREARTASSLVTPRTQVTA
jgi:hypothetical protein